MSTQITVARMYTWCCPECRLDGLYSTDLMQIQSEAEAHDLDLHSQAVS